jgi:5'-deoxynucleotidase YfbR-like HD superfamily hydrolase
MDNSLLTIVRLLKRALPLKELPRTGWIMEGATRSDSDSVAAHSYCVALVSYLTARELNQVQGFSPIRWERVLAMATLHDLAESVTGELATGFKRRIAATPGRQTLIDDLEHEVLAYLLQDLQGGEELTELLREFDLCQTKEAKIVKFADVVDAFAHAKVRLKRTFDRYLDLSEKKLESESPDRDSGVGNHLAGWLRQLRQEWDDVSPLPIS